MDPQDQARATAEWKHLLRQLQDVLDRLDPLGIFIDEETKVLAAGEYADTALELLRRLPKCRSELDTLAALESVTEGLRGEGPVGLGPAYVAAAAEIWDHFGSSPVRRLLGDPQVAPRGPLG